MLQTPEELTIGTEDIYEAEARAIGLEGRTSLVKHISNDNIVADGLHIEWHVVLGQTLIHKTVIGERAVTITRLPVGVRLNGHELECVVENIYAAFAEVRCI